MEYGDLPVDLGERKVDIEEMMYYQYLPVKLKGQMHIVVEDRLMCLSSLINASIANFVLAYGAGKYKASNIYVTAKNKFQDSGRSFNRKGYHCDGFMTDDINYVWSNQNPTVFNSSKFKLSQDDSVSIKEMQSQALEENEVTYSNNALLRLNQYNVHKVAEGDGTCLRAFVKISFSEDKYDLKGNSVNHKLDYNWPMRERESSRNIPQEIKE